MATHTPDDWASDLALDIIAAVHRMPYRQACEAIAARLRELDREAVNIAYSSACVPRTPDHD